MAVTTLAERGELSRAARQFLRTESGSAVLLLGAARAGPDLGEPRRWLRGVLAHRARGAASAALELALDLRHWVNDGLMVLFFFSVGLEISRETTLGELRGVRALAAPASPRSAGSSSRPLLFLAFNAGGPAAGAWGIAISTDTAVVIGVLALVGPRCPDQLRVFLLALAIVDDIGAVAAIAVFYTESVDVTRAAGRGRAVRGAARAAVRPVLAHAVLRG